MGIYVTNYQFRMVCLFFFFILHCFLQLLPFALFLQIHAFCPSLPYSGYAGLCSLLSPKATCYYKSHGASSFSATSCWHCKYLIIYLCCFFFPTRSYVYGFLSLSFCLRMLLLRLLVILDITKKILLLWTNHQLIVDSLDHFSSVHIGKQVDNTFWLMWFFRYLIELLTPFFNSQGWGEKDGHTC